MGSSTCSCSSTSTSNKDEHNRPERKTRTGRNHGCHARPVVNPSRSFVFACWVSGSPLTSARCQGVTSLERGLRILQSACFPTTSLFFARAKGGKTPERHPDVEVCTNTHTHTHTHTPTQPQSHDEKGISPNTNRQATTRTRTITITTATATAAHQTNVSRFTAHNERNRHFPQTVRERERL